MTTNIFWGRSKEKSEAELLENEFESLRTEIEQMVQMNSRLSHDIKRNDLALSHMVKNYEGRQTFIKTLELDINRAESYNKKLQKEFDREFETVETCKSILSSSMDNLNLAEGDEKENEEEEEEEDEEDKVAGAVAILEDISVLPIRTVKNAGACTL